MENEMIERVKAALRSELGVYAGPKKVARVTEVVMAAIKPEIDDLREEAAGAERERSRFFDALCWALGIGGDFPPRQDGEGAYWWRTELRRRAWPDGFPYATQHWKELHAGVPEPEWARDRPGYPSPW